MKFEILKHNRAKTERSGEILPIEGIEIDIKETGGVRRYGIDDPYFKACCPGGLGLTSGGYITRKGGVMLT